MEEQKSGLNIKIITGILAVLLVATAGFAYKFYSDGEEVKTELTNEKIALNKEKDVVLADLQEMVDRYDGVIADNDLKDTELNDARDKIESLMNDIRSKKATIASLSRFRTEVLKLREERNFLFAQNDSLRIDNGLLVRRVDSTNYALVKQKGIKDSLFMENDKLAKRIKKGSALNVDGLKAVGVIQRSSGKLVENSKARRVDKIRVCYTIPTNKLTGKGNKKLFVQVLDPSGVVLGANKEYRFSKGKRLTYSTISKFHYDKTELDVCENIDPSEDKFEPGDYKVSIYDKTQLLTETVVNLK